MGDIRVITTPITKDELRQIAKERFGDMVKAVVDIDKKIMALGGDLHADEEALLLQHGSEQQNLWGINIYPDLPENEWLEFDSMINIRPSQNNRSHSVEDAQIRDQITEMVKKLVL